jgi:hypothetical protein
LSENKNISYDFIWSGQHYSENMKDVFFKQLNVPKPDVEFETDTTNDASTVSSVIKNTFNHLESNKYQAVVFLGDTNTVMGSIGAAQHNIPIVHIEGCMRSYDWRMPEEKYRKTIDHLSDRIYAYLDENPQFIQSTNCSIENVYLIAEYTNPDGWGGYGINFLNATYSSAKNIWGEGWTQLIGMGSDVAPETPSNYRCSAENIHVVKPDMKHTYYSIGFIVNSLECSLINGWQHSPMTAGTPDGSAVSTNLSEKITIENIYVEDLGLTETSEGVLINNTIDSVINNINIGGARRGVATYYTDANRDYANKPNIIKNINIKNSIIALSLGSKYHIVTDINTFNTTNDLSFLNLNSSNNVVKSKINTIKFPTDMPEQNYLQNNSIQGWELKSMYLRPADITINLSDAKNFSTNKHVHANANKNLYMLFKIDSNVKAILSASLFMTFADDSQSAGSSISMKFTKMSGFNGNINESPIVLAEKTIDSTYSSTKDLKVDLSTYIPLYNNADGLKDSVYFVVEFLNPTDYSMLKEVRILYFG